MVYRRVSVLMMKSFNGEINQLAFVFDGENGVYMVENFCHQSVLQMKLRIDLIQ